MSFNIKEPRTQITLIITSALLSILILTFKVATTQPNNMQKPAFAAEPNQEQTLTLSPSDHLKGSPNADIIIYEFADYECPYCSRNHPTIEKLVEHFDGDVAWVYKHFPLDSHVLAQKKAEAAECVAELGGNDAFWKFTQDIYDAGTSISMNTVSEIAANLGIDNQGYKTCLSENRHSDTVAAHHSEGIAAGVSGTPGNVIVHVPSKTQRLIPGALPYTQFEAVINDMLQ